MANGGWDPQKPVPLGITDWLGQQKDEIAAAAAKGEWGYALGRAVSAPFEAIPRGLGYVVGGPVMGTAANIRNALGGPQAEQTDYNTVPLLSGQIPGGDVFDPQKAEARYEAINPVARFVIEMGLGGGIAKIGQIGKLSGWERAREAERALKGASAPAQALGRVGVEKTVPMNPSRLQDLFGSKPAETVGRLVPTIVPAAVGLAAGVGTTSHGLSEGEDPLQAGIEGAGAAFAAVLVAKGVVGMAGKAKALVAPDRPPRLDTSGLAPDLKAGVEHVERNLDYIEGRVVSKNAGPMYPGAKQQPRGMLGPVLGKFTDQQGTDSFIAATLDRNQPLRTWQKFVQGEKRTFVLAARAEAKDPDAWASMGEEERSAAAWREWGTLTPEEKIETAKLPHLQNFVQLASEYTGRAPRLGKYLGLMGADMNAAGLDMRNKAVEGTFDTYITLRAIEERLGQGINTDRWVADDPKSIAQVQGILSHLRAQIDDKFPAPAGSAKTRSGMFEDALQQMTNHYNYQLQRFADSDLITQESADKMIAAKSIYTRGADATHEATYFGQMEGASGWFDQAKAGANMTTATTGLGVTTPSSKPFATSLRLNFEHFAWREGLIQKGELARALAGWREYSPTWKKEMVLAKGDTPSPGKAFIPVMDKVVMEDSKTGLPFEGVIARNYEMPKDLADIVTGMTTENADFVTRVVSKFSGPFRAGITTLSMPFILRNAVKDPAVVLLQNGLSSMTAGNYITAVYDSMTGGRWRDLAAKAGSKFDPIGRLGEAMMSPTPWYKGGPNMTFREEMLTHGGGMGTLSEIMGKDKSVAEMAGLEGGLITFNPIELIRSAAQVFEFSTREAVYITARKAGKAIPESISLAREATVDFSRTGNITRVVNQWVPLLNARMQGTYRTLNAFQDDPEGFMLRAMATIGVPTIMTYVHNREQFGDQYDKIGVEARDSYYPIIFGEYNDRNGDTKPLYFAIPKDAAHQFISTPIEHLLDLIYHTKNAEGQPLAGGNVPWEGGQRTERDTAKMLWDMFLNQSPINLNSSDMADPTTRFGGLAKGVIGANPLFGTVAQLATNQDWRRSNLPITDPANLYAAPADEIDPEESATAGVIARAIGATGIWRPAPSQVAFMAKGFGGTAAQQFMGAADVPLEAIGIAPPKPTDWSQLQIPPGTSQQKYERIADQLSKLDSRPWWVKDFSMVFGSSGGQQTQAAKVQQMSAGDRAAYMDSRNLWADVAKWQSATWRPAVDDLQAKLQAGEITHAQTSKALFDLSKQRLGVIDEAKLAYPGAIVDPKERKAFNESMPGVPVRMADQAAYLKDIEGTALAEAIKRYDNPSRIAGRPDLNVDPTIRNSAQNAELADMAKEWGVDPKDLEDQILATKRGTKLPTLALPAIYVEEAVARYMSPAGVADTKDLESADLAAARTAEVSRMASEWGIPENDLWSRIRARLSFPEERTPVMTSWEQALNLSTQARDATNFPRYADTDGSAMGAGEATWLAWDSELEAAKSKYGTDYNKWPRYFRQLDDAKRRGEVSRLQFLANDPDYLEYTRWFGMGRDLAGSEFNNLTAGSAGWERYKRGTVEDWNVWDYQSKLYEAAPRSSPLRRQLAPKVAKSNRLMTRAWRATLYSQQSQQEAAGSSSDQAAAA